MSKEKSIEATEIFTILSDTINGANFDDLCDATHMIVHIAGYHKQSEGEWTYGVEGTMKCSRCRRRMPKIDGARYCPICGARMKGGDKK